MAFNSPEDWIAALQLKTQNPDGEYMDFFNRWTDALRRNYDVGKQLKPIFGSGNSQLYKEIDKISNRINNTVENVSRDAANKLAVAIFSAILSTGLFALVINNSAKQKKKTKSRSRKKQKKNK